MQTPDENGFVNIQWPSKNIPHGGIFHSRKAEFTEQQKNLHKVITEESRLTLAQRKKSGYKLREETPPPKLFSESDLFHYVIPNGRPRTSKRRSLSAIRASGIYEIDDYRPMKRGEDREKLKDKLANTMAYGDTEIKPTQKRQIRGPKSEPAKLPTKKEMWHDLLTQIRERADWLQEMEDLGHAGPHREFIKEQIAERLRALDALGVDSECSSVRSGFSTIRSREDVGDTKRSQGSGRSNKSTKSKASSGKKADSAKSDHSKCSTGSQGKPNIVKSITSPPKKGEENVAAYEHLSQLQYSPRRRV